MVTIRLATNGVEVPLDLIQNMTKYGVSIYEHGGILTLTGPANLLASMLVSMMTTSEDLGVPLEITLTFTQPGKGNDTIH